MALCLVSEVFWHIRSSGGLWGFASCRQGNPAVCDRVSGDRLAAVAYLIKRPGFA